MIKQNPSSRKEELIGVLSDAVMRWQDATEKYDETVGEMYGLNTAERHCLSLLWRGALPPGVIAREIGLTPPAVTALVDRLVSRGYLTREPDPDDRRRQRIATTELTRRMTADTYQPMAEKGRVLLSGYTQNELETIARFATEALRIQEEATAELLARRAATGKPPRSGRRKIESA